MPGWLAVADDQQNKSKSSFRTSATTNHKTMHVAYTFQEDRQNAEVENFIVADCSATTTKNKAIEKISCPGLSARLTMVYIKYGTRLNHAARGPRLLERSFPHLVISIDVDVCHGQFICGHVHSTYHSAHRDT